MARISSRSVPLSVFPIRIPPLRQRKADIPNLVDHFLRRKYMELKMKAVPPLVPGAIDQLTVRQWKGNVRESENVVERTLIQHKSGPLVFDFETYALREEIPGAFAPSDESLKLDDIISNHIERVLNMTEGKINGPDGAAQLLGVHPSTLRNRMKKLGIPYGRIR